MASTLVGCAFPNPAWGKTKSTRFAVGWTRLVGRNRHQGIQIALSRMDTDTLQETYRTALLEDILPFWLRHGLDSQNGGYFSSLDRDGRLLDSDKSVWVQGRFAWLLPTLCQSFGANDQWLATAKSGLKFIDRHCIDPDDGLMWFHVTAEGRGGRRYRFSEAFACMANAAYFRCTGDQACAAKAAGFFQTFKPTKGSFALPISPQFTGTRPSKGIGVPMIGINMAQTCRAAGVPGIDWDAEISASIAEIQSDFVHPDIGCVMETVAVDGTRIDHHFDGRTLNPGHAIEAAWFISGSQASGEGTALIALGTQMLDWMWERGWDKEYGGMLYFVGVDGKPVQEYWHDMKFW